MLFDKLQDGKTVTTKVYDNCSCVRQAWDSNRLNYSDISVKRDLLSLSKPVSADVINTARASLHGSPISGASEGWCPVDCGGVLTMFMVTMFVLMILSSTGRIGSVLVALRCVEIQDKSLSMVSCHKQTSCPVGSFLPNGYSAQLDCVWLD